MDKGYCFLMGVMHSKTPKKHLWVVISDIKKHAEGVIIINFTKDETRSGGTCFFCSGEHAWLTEPKSWVCFPDATFIPATSFDKILNGIKEGFIIPCEKMPSAGIDKIIHAAKMERSLFDKRLLKYLD